MRFLLAILLVGTFSACPLPGPVQPAAEAVINCLGENRPAIDTLLNEFRPLISGKQVSWSDVYVRGKQAGKDVGACFVMELAQWYLGGTRSGEDAQAAFETAQRFRDQEAGGATISTMCVAQDGTKKACKL